MFQPLKGIRVIDLSQILAGPYATYQLAMMGAEVIKIEKPGEGDWTRTGGPLPGLADRRMALGFLGHNAGKKSVTLDLKSPDGLEIARQLLTDADVFVENFKPGVADRLGLGFETLREINPKLVYCSISAFGQDGPLSNRPAYDHVIQGMCGIMLTTGKPGDGPVKVGAPYIDYATGMNAAMAILAALREVERTETAVQVDVAMLDTAMALMASLMSTHLTTGWKPVQNGNEAWSASPSSGAFDTSDGVLMLAANHDVQFRNMCSAIGREDILQDARWAHVAERHANWKSLRETLEQTFLSKPATFWEDTLAKAAVPAGRIRSLDEMLAEPQVSVRGLTREIHVEGHEGPIHIPTMSFKVNGENSTSDLVPQLLGADTETVLRAAGYSQAKLDALRTANVI
ncbi:CaiB/BaiF CoA transferase family protein [Thalassovita taeanensis]|uniref:Crotonobetainyl-CoA:carnitine CoA-transferase CaiB n=1 Tax=Thalassovita taeanensis TaxID=657014 RepID=A0A1H9LEM8_9RHOB|nr:CoA transferase [Thalassovita taeanensis]SER09657.1 Crotonobetainyl-CoA:carnitine CoA-transferase CaiB [Thalassovita taeanensis]